MPSAKFVKTSPIQNTFRTASIKGQFDIADMKEVTTSFDVDIPCNSKEWNIGLIVGASGTGKTTIAKELFKDYYFFNGFEWNAPNLVDDFPKDCKIDEIVTALSSAGLVSAPDYLKPFHVLSNGQKMRAEIARLFLEYTDKPVIYDEFTSVVDRQVAQVTSHVISKYIRKQKKQFIALSCHRDIIDWLNPDWIFDTDTNSFAWRSPCQRPAITLKIRHATYAEWQLFERYHYLSANHHTGAVRFLAEYNGVPVAWCSVLPLPNVIKNLFRVHRLVVRGDYQGLGIGKILLNFVGDYYKKHNRTLHITTSLKYFVKAMTHNPAWQILSKAYNKSNSGKLARSLNRKVSLNRLTASFKYKG